MVAVALGHIVADPVQVDNASRGHAASSAGAGS